jgi:hypothetical protein
VQLTALFLPIDVQKMSPINCENQLQISLGLKHRVILDPRSSGVLQSVEWQVLTGVSGQPIGSIFKGVT